MIEIDEDKLIRCPVCEAVNIEKGEENTCRRCGSAINKDKSFSTEKVIFCVTNLGPFGDTVKLLGSLW